MHACIYKVWSIKAAHFLPHNPQILKVTLCADMCEKIIKLTVIRKVFAVYKPLFFISQICICSC